MRGIGLGQPQVSKRFAINTRWIEEKTVNHIAKDDTNRLISSNKVEGANVYHRTGEKLGSIYNFIVDNRSGKAGCAVLEFGGLFGMGSGYCPLPWQALEYDTEHDDYVVDLDRSVLEDAPKYATDSQPALDNIYTTRL